MIKNNLPEGVFNLVIGRGSTIGEKLLNDIKIVADNLRQDGDKRRFTKNAFNNIIKDLLSSNQFDLRHVENAPIKYGKIGTYKSDLSVITSYSIHYTKLYDCYGRTFFEKL